MRLLFACNVAMEGEGATRSRRSYHASLGIDACTSWPYMNKGRGAIHRHCLTRDLSHLNQSLCYSRACSGCIVKRGRPQTHSQSGNRPRPNWPGKLALDRLEHPGYLENLSPHLPRLCVDEGRGDMHCRPIARVEHPWCN